MLTPQTKQAVRRYILLRTKKFIDDNLSNINAADSKPFHARLMPTPYEWWRRFSERSFSTRSGNWLQEIARIIASSYHSTAVKNYKVLGQISPASEAHMHELLDQMERGRPHRLPNRQRDLDQVLTVQGTTGVARVEISDLYVKTSAGNELYFEMKTPQPNKTQCREMKRWILTVSALRYEQFVAGKVTACAATAYNPYGDGQPYVRPYARQFLEINKDFLIGRAFWERIGDNDTYDELLTIAAEVGDELKPLTQITQRGTL